MKPRNALTLSCRIAAIFLSIGLAGCISSGARNWGKPGVGDSQRAKDYDYCRSLTRSTTRQSDNINQDITASRGSDWRKLGNYDSQSAQVSQGDADSAARIMHDCMKDRGYQPL